MLQILTIPTWMEHVIYRAKCIYLNFTWYRLSKLYPPQDQVFGSWHFLQILYSMHTCSIVQLVVFLVVQFTYIFMIAHNGNRHVLIESLFKMRFCIHCLAWVQRHLILDMNYFGSCIFENSFTMELIVVCFATIAFSEVTRSLDNIPVPWNHVSWLILDLR